MTRFRNLGTNTAIRTEEFRDTVNQKYGDKPTLLGVNRVNSKAKESLPQWPALAKMF